MSLDAQYAALHPRLARLEPEVCFGLERALAPTGVKIHSITSRVKSLASIATKASTKGYTDPLEQSTDLVGARIVCLYLRDLPVITEAVRGVYEVLEDDDKVHGGPTSEFGYMSHHLVCRLGSSHAGPRYEGLHDLLFEVQCRTILMDAWANVSHHLAYKGTASIPDDLQRDFAALSGLFYVADRQFEQLAASTESVARVASGLIESTTDLTELPLNRATLSAWLRRRFPDRKAAEERDVSELVEELDELGFETISQVDDMFRDARAAVELYEVEHPPGDALRYAAVGIVRMALSLLFESDRATRGTRQNVETFLAAHPGVVPEG